MTTPVGSDPTPHAADATEDIVREVTGLVRALKDLHRGADLEGDADGETLVGPSFVILWRLGEGGPQRVSALADALYVDISTVSRQLTALEEVGWVARRRDPADARAYLVELTSDGGRVLDRNRERRLTRLRRVLADWSAEDRQRLARDLARFNQALEAARATSGSVAGEEIA